MNEDRTGAGHFHGDARAGPAVSVRSLNGRLEVALARGFQQADVDAIKCILGRSWVKKRLVWVLPHTRAVLDALKESFGSRLVFAEAPPKTVTTRRFPAPPPTDWPHRASRIHQTEVRPASGGQAATSPQPERGRAADGVAPDRDAVQHDPGGRVGGSDGASRDPSESQRPPGKRSAWQQTPGKPSASQQTPGKPSEPQQTSSTRPGGSEHQAGSRGAISQYASGTAAESSQHTSVKRSASSMHQAIRLREYSRKTERAYISWVQRFLRFHADVAHDPDRLKGSHATAFLDHLASAGRLAAGSRNQAASALSFMFQEVLGRDEMADVARERGPSRLPVVLSHREVLRVLRELTGMYFLIAVLLYSAGLRLEECLRMRVKDIDVELRQILVRDGKGRKDRYVPLSRRAMDLLRAQIGRVAERHEKDRAHGDGWAFLPGALHRKDPTAGHELAWQFVFAATGNTTDPATGRTCRVPLHPTAMQREMKRAVRRSGIPKRATCHTFRHSFATEALRGGCDIRTLQHVMGHKDIRTTMIYLHVIEQTGMYIRSPLDRPDDPEDFDVDPVGRPLSRVGEHSDLAARQWDPQRHRPPDGRSRRANPRDPPRRADDSPSIGERGV